MLAMMNAESSHKRGWRPPEADRALRRAAERCHRPGALARSSAGRRPPRRVCAKCEADETS